MKKTFLLIICFFILLFSCKQNNSKKSSSDKKMNDAIEKAVGKSASMYDNKLDELLTLDIAAMATGYTASEAEKDYQKVLSSTKTHSMAYLWQKGRIEKIKSPITDKFMEVPTKDKIELRWVTNTTLEKFKQNYHTPTAEEMENAEKAMNNKMSEMQQEGKINTQQKDDATGLAKGFMSGVSFTDVPNVGDYAVWNNKTKELKIFYSGLEFEIRVELGNENKNKTVSIAAAQEIIKHKLN